MTNNIVTVIISSKYLQINEIHDIRERFIILEVYIIFVGIQLKDPESRQRLEFGIQVPLPKFHSCVPGIPSLESRSQDCLRLRYRKLKCLY